LLNFVYINLDFLKLKVLAPKIIHTRSHPDPEPVTTIDNPKKLLRKRNTVEGQGSSNPLLRENSLLEKLISIHDIEFDLPFEHSLFRTKSDSFVNEIVLCQTILQSKTPERLSPKTDFDQRILQEFEKLQDLASNLDQVLSKAHFQQSVELSAISIAASFVNPQVTQTIPPSHASSTSSISSPPITQVVIQPPPLIMVARYAPLVLVAPLHAMP
jgi:hypothetical protein